MELQTMEGASGNVGRRTCSLLFDDTAARADVLREQPPECFSDLNLDQVVSAVTAGREDRHLEPYYFTPVASADAVEFRHGVFRDLEDRGLLAAVRAFADQMEVVRRDLAFAEKFSYAPERQRWFLDAAREYRVATVALGQALSEAPIAGRGFLRFREYVIAYISGHAFTSLGADAERVLNLLEEVTYCVHLRGGRVEVSRYEGEPDYTAQVIETFARFRQGAVTEYRVRLADRVDMNHEAPSPASAMLSAALLNTGMYAIIRFQAIARAALGDRFPSNVLFVFGFVTIFVGVLFSGGHLATTTRLSPRSLRPASSKSARSSSSSAHAPTGVDLSIGSWSPRTPGTTSLAWATLPPGSRATCTPRIS
jgi:hypothetical protein